FQGRSSNLVAGRLAFDRSRIFFNVSKLVDLSVAAFILARFGCVFFVFGAGLQAFVFARIRVAFKPDVTAILGGGRAGIFIGLFGKTLDRARVPNATPFFSRGSTVSV
ncbi:MAG: hypothetical protein AAGJ35_13730, partial [Myxococcota bacterium]